MRNKTLLLMLILSILLSVTAVMAGDECSFREPPWFQAWLDYVDENNSLEDLLQACEGDAQQEGIADFAYRVFWDPESVECCLLPKIDK